MSFKHHEQNYISIFRETPYDLEKYTGRFRHFFRQQNPLNGAATRQQLQDAKEYIRSVEDIKLDPEKYWKSKYLYDSAYHPTTGDLLVLPGRMSFQAPGNSLLALGMITFYRHNVIFISHIIVYDSVLSL